MYPTRRFDRECGTVGGEVDTVRNLQWPLGTGRFESVQES